MTTTLALTALFLTLGFAAGLVHFATLGRVTSLYLAGGSPAQAVGLQLVRLAALACVLILLAWLGAPALLAGALGVILARGVILRRARKAA
ncbi:MAG TPA: ATP synthase subunit I [Rhodobacteraceae bacterium]|nr:ATP synthase subunit I [Paracoccaceae bacterium]